MITLESLKSKDILIRKLCAFFHAPRKEVVATSVSDDIPIYNFPFLKEDPFNFDESFYCAHLPKLNILSLFDADKVESTGILTAWREAISISPEGYVTPHVALYLKGTLWVISYRDEGIYHNGYLSICSDEYDLVMRPIRNMLLELQQ